MMRCATLFLFLALLIVGLQPVRAADRYGPTIGGTGGNQFALRCPAGGVVVGVVGGAGAYVDRIGPVCSGNSAGYAGGTGSPNKDAYCPQGSMISRIAVQTLRSANHLLNALRIECVERVNPSHVTATIPYYTPSDGDTSQTLEFWMNTLNPNEIRTHADTPSVGLLTCAPDSMVGFQGNAGASIDAFGLICGR